jgi:carbonic anhydrase
LKSIIDGVIKFRRKDFKEHKELFTELKSTQNPHTLFIGCSDSRLVPNLITNTLPGELFVIRNIANLIPKYRETEEYVATTSAIEYAVQVHDVENIIVSVIRIAEAVPRYIRTKRSLRISLTSRNGWSWPRP